MSHQDRDLSSSSEGAETKVRRPYEAPAIAESAAFETLALACAVTGGERMCRPPFGTPSRS